MKILLILLFAGFASATLQEELQNEAKSMVVAFVNGLQTATPLHIVLGVESSEGVQRLERDIKEELKKHIEEAFEKALKQIEDAIERKKEVNQEALKMLKDLKEKMKELDIQDNEVTEELEVLKAKVDKHLRQILEKMGVFDKRSIDSEDPELLQSVLGDMSIKDMLSKLKIWIMEKLDVKTFRNAVIKIVGQVTTKLCEWLTSKGKEKVIDFFDRFLESDSEQKKRASEDRYQEIKDYLKNIEENVDDKLAKFKKWLHDLIDSGVDKAKEKFQKVRDVIKEIIAESKTVSKKGLSDILEHIKEFEDKFGSLYDLRNILQEFLKKKD